MAKKHERRFQTIYEEKHGIAESYQVVRDSTTSVCYVLAASGYGVGFTPLLDADGRPVVDPTTPALE